MAFFKDPVLKSLKDMIVKGPRGYANEKMAESLPKAEEVMNLDRSNPEAMRAYMQGQMAQISAVMNSPFGGKRMISEENRAGFERVMNQAIENQAAMYGMLQQHKAANAVPSAAQEAAAAHPPDDVKQESDPPKD